MIKNKIYILAEKVLQEESIFDTFIEAFEKNDKYVVKIITNEFQKYSTNNEIKKLNYLVSKYFEDEKV